MGGQLSDDAKRHLRAVVAENGLDGDLRTIESVAKPAIHLYGSVQDRYFDAVAAVRRVYPDFEGDYRIARQRWEQIRRQQLPLGASRLGGLPDLPAVLDWPVNSVGQKLHFAMQLDCSVLPRMSDKVLPECGWLYVFIENSTREFPLPCRVLYYPGGLESLHRSDESAEAELAEDASGKRECFDVAPITAAKPGFSLPQYDQEGWDLVEAVRDSDAYELISRRPAGCICRLLGHGGSNGLSPSQAVATVAEGLGEDWTTLVRLLRYGNMEWLGDCSMEVYIRCSDVLRSDFAKCYACPSPL